MHRSLPPRWCHVGALPVARGTCATDDAGNVTVPDARNSRGADGFCQAILAARRSLKENATNVSPGNRAKRQEMRAPKTSGSRRKSALRSTLRGTEGNQTNF